MKSILLTFVAFCVVAVFPAHAQIKTPAPSPFCKFTQTVGLTDITVEYSRPGKKGRDIYGSLVPFDKIWRTGANATTKITFSDDVKIMGKPVPKGKYALWTIPGADSWTIILSKNNTGSAGEYNIDEDLMRFDAEIGKLNDEVETFTISVGNITNNSAMISLDWENIRASFKVETIVDDLVMENIKNVMAGPSSGDYYRAASYYFETERDMQQALTWANKANEGEEKYWVMSLKAQIEAKMGKMKEASLSAQSAMRLAEKAGNEGMAEENRKRLAEWSKKK